MIVGVFYSRVRQTKLFSAVARDRCLYKLPLLDDLVDEVHFGTVRIFSSTVSLMVEPW